MSNDLPPYDPKVFELMKYADSLPKNRRGGARRQEERRDELNLSSRNLRQQSNRRQTDRREIVLSLFIKRPPEDVFNFFAEPENLTKVFPELKNVNSQDIRKHIKDVYFELIYEDIAIKWREIVALKPLKQSLEFHLKNGDLDICEGGIDVADAPQGSRIGLTIYVSLGFPGLERFVGHVFVSKFRRILEAALIKIKNYLENLFPKLPRFAFLVHSTNLDFYPRTFNDSSFRHDKKPILDKIFTWLPPFKCAHVSDLRSATGAMAEGDFIYSPLTPKYIMEGRPEFVLNHIIEAGKIAKDLGAQILGLGAYTAFVGKDGIEVERAVGLPVTTGTSYTVAVCLRTIKNACQLVGINIKKAIVAIIGATGTVGKICAEILATESRQLLLVGRTNSKLNVLTKYLSEHFPDCKFVSDINHQDIYAKADIIVIATNDPEFVLNLHKIKPGVVVCDISQPHNVSEVHVRERTDILVIDGGIVLPPGDINLNFNFGLPPRFVFACMAETMILALEERFESFSIGGNVTVDKVYEIERLAKQHGFKLAGLKIFGQLVNEDRINRVRKINLSKK